MSKSRKGEPDKVVLVPPKYKPGDQIRTPRDPLDRNQLDLFYVIVTILEPEQDYDVDVWLNGQYHSANVISFNFAHESLILF